MNPLREMKALPRKFYMRNTIPVAKDLLGKTLVRRIGKQTLVGIITETQGINVSVRWIQPFWQADKRIEISTFPRAEIKILSKA